MADERNLRTTALLGPGRRLALDRESLIGPASFIRDFVGLHPGVSPPVPPPAPPPSVTPAPPPPVLPAPAVDSPFDHLPFPSPGERIKAEDFRALSQGIRTLYEMQVLSAKLFGRTFGESRLALTAQQYQITRVMSVFGTEISNPGDTSMDGRKVIQVLPDVPGARAVLVVVTEAVDTRRFAPNLIGLTYREANERIRMLLGDVAVTGAPVAAPQLTGLSLTEAQQGLPK